MNASSSEDSFSGFSFMSDGECDCRNYIVEEELAASIERIEKEKFSDFEWSDSTQSDEQYSTPLSCVIEEALTTLNYDKDLRDTSFSQLLSDNSIDGIDSSYVADTTSDEDDHIPLIQLKAIISREDNKPPSNPALSTCNNEQPEIINNEQQPKTSNNQKQSETSNNQQQPETSNNQQQPETSNNQQQPETSNNQQQPETSNNQQQPETSNNQQQPETSNNQQQPETSNNQQQPETSNNQQQPETTEKSRKRKRNEAQWKRNIRKSARNTGKSYTSATGVQIEAKEIGRGCGLNCRYKCHHNITPADRRKVFTQFWELGHVDRQRDYICKSVSKQCKLQSTCKDSKRKFTYCWYLIQDESKVKVCKQFYLDTLAIKETVVYTALEKLSSEGIVETDKRGKHMNRSKQITASMKEEIKEHIKSFPVTDSHYTRKESSRQYLQSELNISKMYLLYLEKCVAKNTAPGKKWLYQHIFNNEFNLGFFVPKKDQCDFCINYQNSSDQEKRDMQEKYTSHIKNKEISRKEKDLDKDQAISDNSLTCACFDFQKVLPVPCGNVSTFYYKRKLAVYNFTIFDLGRKQGFCYMWHEGIASRGPNEVGSCIYDFIEQTKEKTNTTKFTFYSDNCAGQNKNKYIPTMFAKAIACLNLNKITHKFLEKGHTQNEGDSMHALIERMKGNTSMFVPEQYYMLARLAKKNEPKYVVKEMSTNDFLDFKCLESEFVKNWKIDEEGNRVNWCSMKVLELRRESPSSMFYKCDYGDTFKTIDLHRRVRACRAMPNLCSIEVNKLLDGPVPISTDKYKDLKSLCKSNAIPRHYHQFYESLFHEDLALEE